MIAGVETLRVLAGSVGVASFTVNSLARRTGVSRDTVDTVLRRHRGVFERLDPIPGPGRGRPQVRWQLRAEAVDQVVAEVNRLQSVIEIQDLGPDNTIDADVVEASLALAADAVLRAPVGDPRAAMSLVAAAKSSLLAAGYDFTGDEALSTGLPETDPRGNRARIISTVADLVEAEATGGLDRLDSIQAKALPLVTEARSSMSAEEWLPLANRVVSARSSVLAAPIEVMDPGGQKLIEQLFPNLTAVSDGSIDVDSGEGTLEPVQTLVLADGRITSSPAGTQLPSVILQVLLEPATATTVADLLNKAVHRPTTNVRPIAKWVVYAEHMDSNAMVKVAGSLAQLVLVGHDTRNAQTDFARVVNRAAVGLDTPIPEPSLMLKC